MRNIMILISLMLSIIAINEVQAASFDCKSAKTNVEQLICSDRALSYYDELLNEEYKAALQKASDKEELKNNQREWIENLHKKCEEELQRKKKENDITYDDPYTLLSEYKERISLIRARYSTFVYTGDGQYDYVGTEGAHEGWRKYSDESGRLSAQSIPGNKLKFQLKIVDDHGICSIGENGSASATFLDNRHAVYVDANSCIVLFSFDKNLVTVFADTDYCEGYCNDYSLMLLRANFYKKSDTPVFLQDTKASGKKAPTRIKKRIR